MKPTATIFGVPFHSVSLVEAVYQLHSACEQQKRFFCVTPNPEICLLTLRHPDFLKTLQSAQLSIADGFGILWALRYLKGKKTFFRWVWTLLTPHLTLHGSGFPERVTGTDLMHRFLISFPNRKVFLLGASPEVNELLGRKLRASGVNVVGNVSGSPDPKEEHALRKSLNDSGAEVLFVAFGAPKQEEWISRNFPHLSSVRVAMGVGGAFDFLSGTKKRAPRLMRKFGLEWLFRLLLEPKRIKRIVQATLVFPWKVYRS